VHRCHAAYGEADRADRRVADIHAAMFGACAGRDSELRERRDDGAFDCAYHRDDFTKAFEPDDRIHDQLARTVIGHVSAALDLYDIDAAGRQYLSRREHVLALRVPAEGDDRVVLDHDPCVASNAARDFVVNRSLQFENVAIG
jgi:hypothetical protein